MVALRAAGRQQECLIEASASPMLARAYRWPTCAAPSAAAGHTSVLNGAVGRGATLGGIMLAKDRRCRQTSPGEVQQ